MISIDCPACEEAVAIDEVELREASEYRCPACTIAIDWAPDPEPAYVELQAA